MKDNELTEAQYHAIYYHRRERWMSQFAHMGGDRVMYTVRKLEKALGIRFDRRLFFKEVNSAIVQHRKDVQQQRDSETRKE